MSDTHVWAFDTDVTQAEAESVSRLLSPDERNRAGRLRDETDRQRFVVRRGMLRVILARYVGQAPQDLQFDYSALGKPSLRGAASDEGLRFSATASGSVGIAALRRRVEIGVDVERIRDVPVAVARRALTPAERKEFDGLTEARRAAYFFRMWAGKEAVTKSIGRGLRQSFTELALPGYSDAEECRVHLPHDIVDAGWLLSLPEPRAGYVAALAAVAPFGTLRLWSIVGAPGD